MEKQFDKLDQIDEKSIDIDIDIDVEKKNCCPKFLVCILSFGRKKARSHIPYKDVVIDGYHSL